MYTRDEFEVVREQNAEAMAGDASLAGRALDVLVSADRYNWIHQTNWLGEPILQLPQDMFALQDIIYRTRPEFIVEVGVAWGGGLLFYATILEALGLSGHVIGVDVYVPDDLRARLASYGALSDRITLVEGSSTDPATLEIIKRRLGGSDRLLVNLDSHHTHDHVLAELRIYADFVGEGCYLVCADTVLNDIPVQDHRPRTWGPEDNPKTALDVFLAEQPRFVVDEALSRRLLLTCNPGGYVRATASRDSPS